MTNENRMVVACRCWPAAVAAPCRVRLRPSMTFTCGAIAGQRSAQDLRTKPSQTLTITGVRTAANSHGTATFAERRHHVHARGGLFRNRCQLFYTACDNGTTNGTGRSALQRGDDHDQRDREPSRPRPTRSQCRRRKTASAGVTLTAPTMPTAIAVQFTIVTPPSHGTLTGTAPALTYSAGAELQRCRHVHVRGERRVSTNPSGDGDHHRNRGQRPAGPAARPHDRRGGKPVTLPKAFLLEQRCRGAVRGSESNADGHCRSGRRRHARHGEPERRRRDLYAGSRASSAPQSSSIPSATTAPRTAWPIRVAPTRR